MQNQIPKNWKKVNLGEVLKIRRGASPRPIHEYITNVGMPWLKIADVTSSDSRFVDSTNEYIKNEGVSKSVTVKPGTLILSNSATPGLPRFMRITACVHDGWLILEPINDSISKNYLYYRLIVDRKKLVSNVTGAVFDNLKTDVLRDHEILLPSIEEQQQISSILSAFDDKIEVNKKIAKNLEEMAQAFFKEWFVNFRFPGHEKVKMVDSELGKIPEGWEISTVGDVCISIADGDWIETKDQGGHDYRLLQVSNIGIGSFVETGNLHFITKETFDKLRCTEIRSGDILVARMPKPTGRAWLVTDMPWRLVTAVDIAIVRTNPAKIRHNLLTYYFNSPANLEAVDGFITGSTRSRLTRRDLAMLQIIVPPLLLQDKWEKFANDSYIKIINLRKENQKLAALRDLLLPKLMKGEIRV